MAVEVRPLEPTELETWVDVMHLAFHSNQSATKAADWRREVGVDYQRTLAAVEAGQIVGTYESFPAELTLPGNTCVQTNAISSVTVLPTHHRRGVLTQMITRDLQAARHRGDAAAILLASEYPIYGRFGFGPATQRAEYSIDPSLARFTQPATRRIELVPQERMRATAPGLFDKFRKITPGQIDRHPDIQWDARVGLRQSPYGPQDRIVRCALSIDSDGAPDGYLLLGMEDFRQPYRPSGVVQLAELIALSAEAYLSLWRFVCEMDLIGEIRAGQRRVKEPLAWLLDNPRAALQLARMTDYLWVRPLDVPKLLGSRQYATRGSLVLQIDDPLGLTGGTFRLEAEDESATCQPSSASPDLRMGVHTLGALSLGGVSVRVLHEAGLIEEQRPRALSQAEHMFESPIEPWCSTFF
jgi:predicted acetyltransferase